MGIIRTNRGVRDVPAHQAQHQRGRAREAAYYQRQYDEDDGAYEGVPAEAPWNDVADERLDAALHLASHAARLGRLEQALGQISETTQSIQAMQAEAQLRQKYQTIIMAGIFTVALVFVGVLPFLAQPRPAAQKTAQAAAVPATEASAAQAAMTTAEMQLPPNPAARIPLAAKEMPEETDYAPPVSYSQKNNAALGAQMEAEPAPSSRAFIPAPPAPPIRVSQVFTPLQNMVRTKMAKNGEVPPASWQPMFDRDAQGELKGKLQIAAKFLKGEEVTRDQAFAVQLIKEAAEAGEKEAMMWLAYAYQAGNLGRVDLAQAAHWFEVAGKAGIARAMTELGRIYEAGIDGAPDPDLALAWYQRAKQAGDNAAAESVTRLARAAAAASMTVQNAMQPAQIMAQPIAQPNERPLTPSASQVLSSTHMVKPSGAQPPAAALMADASDRSAGITPPPLEEGSAANAVMEPANDVRAAQRMLKALGYQIDYIDGMMGPNTASAIRKYQRSKMLYPDGDIGPQLMESLTNDMRWGG